jgi:uncharacterized protein YecT (DUF1311 family)
MTGLRLGVMCVVWLTAAGAAGAQETDCGAAVTQQDMNFCAAEEYRAADSDLNAVWRRTVTWAQGAGLEDDLRAAQRAWIAFRDAACGVEAAVYAGGSLAPLVHATCMTRLTKARSADLVLLSGG